MSYITLKYLKFLLDWQIKSLRVDVSNRKWQYITLLIPIYKPRSVSYPWTNASFYFFARYEDGTEFLSMEADLCDEDTEAYVTNLSYYHLVPFETDILE